MVQTGNSSPERRSDSRKMAQPGGVRVRIQSYIHRPPPQSPHPPNLPAPRVTVGSPGPLCHPLQGDGEECGPCVAARGRTRGWGAVGAGLVCPRQGPGPNT